MKTIYLTIIFVHMFKINLSISIILYLLVTFNKKNYQKVFRK